MLRLVLYGKRKYLIVITRSESLKAQIYGRGFNTMLIDEFKMMIQERIKVASTGAKRSAELAQRVEGMFFSGDLIAMEITFVIARSEDETVKWLRSIGYELVYYDQHSSADKIAYHPHTFTKVTDLVGYTKIIAEDTEGMYHMVRACANHSGIRYVYSLSFGINIDVAIKMARQEFRVVYHYDGDERRSSWDLPPATYSNVVTNTHKRNLPSSEEHLMQMLYFVSVHQGIRSKKFPELHAGADTFAANGTWRLTDIEKLDDDKWFYVYGMYDKVLTYHGKDDLMYFTPGYPNMNEYALCGRRDITLKFFLSKIQTVTRGMHVVKIGLDVDNDYQLGMGRPPFSCGHPIYTARQFAITYAPDVYTDMRMYAKWWVKTPGPLAMIPTTEVFQNWKLRIFSTALARFTGLQPVDTYTARTIVMSNVRFAEPTLGSEQNGFLRGLMRKRSYIDNEQVPDNEAKAEIIAGDYDVIVTERPMVFSTMNIAIMNYTQFRSEAFRVPIFISGHLVNLILIANYMPVDLAQHFEFVRFNLQLVKKNKRIAKMAQRAARDGKIIEERAGNAELWHSWAEMVLAVHTAKLTANAFNIECDSEVTDFCLRELDKLRLEFPEFEYPSSSALQVSSTRGIIISSVDLVADALCHQNL
jgi:hypothetical protein